jgi:outer membrane protein TolC
VADNYYELLSLDNQLDIIHQYIDLQKKALEVAKSKAGNGCNGIGR